MDVYDQLHKAVHDARQMLDRADREKRDLTADEQTTYGRIDQEIDRLTAVVEKQEQAAAAKNRRIAPASAGRNPAVLDYPAGWSVPTMLRGRRARQTTISLGTSEHARLQQSYQRNFTGYLLNGDKGREHLALQVTKNAQGGYLAPTTFVAELIKTLDDEVFMRQLSRVLPPIANSVSLGVPTRDSRLNSADWTPEIPAADIAEDDSLRFGKRELTPHLCTKLVKASNKFLRSSLIEPDTFIRDELAYTFIATLENAYLAGDGVLKPLGVFVPSADGVPTSRDVICASATVFTSDEIIDLLFNLKGQYQRNATGLFSREAVKRIRKLKDNTGQYLWQPGLAGTPSTILERPYVMSEFAPSTFTAGLYVGMFADFQAGYWIVDSLEMTVQVLVELFSLRNQTGYLGGLETDGMPVLAEAFSRLRLA